MHIETILSEEALRMIEKSHALRRRSLYFAVEALLTGGRLGLTSLGRGAHGRVAPKHNIKRIDRLLGNQKLHSEMKLYFGSIAATVLDKDDIHPIILIDWTRIDANFGALTAAVPSDGRALVVYSEAHPMLKWGNPKVEREFLQNLALVIPPEKVPVIITDAGYRNPWFREVKALGWHFVGRLTSQVYLGLAEGQRRADDIYSDATTQPQSLGNINVAREPAALKMHVVLGIRFKRKSVRKKRWRKAHSQGTKQIVKRKQEPWVIGTSLNYSPDKIIELYSLRMQIEESFRDIKNPRFGWSFRHAFSRSAERYNVLMLISALATLVVTAIGRLAEEAGCAADYQANTIRNRRVLSLFFLGKELIRRREWEALPGIDALSNGVTTWNLARLPGDP